MVNVADVILIDDWLSGNVSNFDKFLIRAESLEQSVYLYRTFGDNVVPCVIKDIETRYGLSRYYIEVSTSDIYMLQWVWECHIVKSMTPDKRQLKLLEV